jgi:hypothetical protein
MKKFLFLGLVTLSSMCKVSAIDDASRLKENEVCTLSKTFKKFSLGEQVHELSVEKGVSLKNGDKNSIKRLQRSRSRNESDSPSNFDLRFQTPVKKITWDDDWIEKCNRIEKKKKCRYINQFWQSEKENIDPNFSLKADQEKNTTGQLNIMKMFINEGDAQIMPGFNQEGTFLEALLPRKIFE